ncbi:MAG: threonine/serine exporter family protein [Peptococcaceae bacterium]|nr:threonine/serine exporter family protein [Peptococcaceae bacterium]
MEFHAVHANHMAINWQALADHNGDAPLAEAVLEEKAYIIGRVGLSMLACGTGAWRIRSAMNTVAESLGVVCTASIGLLSLDYTCFENGKSFSQSWSLKNTGVNTDKLALLEHFVKAFPEHYSQLSGNAVSARLDEINGTPGNYTPVALGLAAAFACCAFTFLLGGGPVEMLGAFCGAGVGNFVRVKLLHKKFTLFLCIFVSIALACATYALAVGALEALFHVSSNHQVGYVCAALFIIPGFPFITSGIDMSKLDFRSGLERLTYALMIILVATMTAWVIALALHLQPGNFPPLDLAPGVQLALRLVASFCGVFGFSMMFNSPVAMAGTAAFVGAIANTLRLTLVDFSGLPPAVCAFVGALTAGLIASLLNSRRGFPRITLTVPSIVIMVPGLYLYRGIYNFGAMALDDASYWLISAALIVIALPLGLICARILTDPEFRYCT